MMGMESSGSGAATKAAQDEAWRQSNINQAVGQVDQIYGSPRRQADYNDFLGASRTYYTNELEKQKGVADRSLKFAMARSGLTGGSASADANRLLGQKYTQGILDADRLAQGAVADLRAADQNSRLNLISQVQSGLDVTSGAQQAAQALQGNLASGRSSMRASNLGDIFGGLAAVYDRSRDMAAERRGNQAYGLVYQPGFGMGGTR